MLGGMISGALRSAGRSMDAYGQETMKCGIVHTPRAMLGNVDRMTIWTLQTYRDDLNLARADNDNAEEAWKKLESPLSQSWRMTSLWA